MIGSMYRLETSCDKPLVQSRHNTHMLAILVDNESRYLCPFKDICTQLDLCLAVGFQ